MKKAFNIGIGILVSSPLTSYINDTYDLVRENNIQ